MVQAVLLVTITDQKELVQVFQQLHQQVVVITGPVVQLTHLEVLVVVEVVVVEQVV